MTKPLSVVIPTYNETLNIRPLVTRLAESYPHPADLEILIVDDESPGSAETAQIVRQLQAESFPVRIHQRFKKDGERGLSSAVLLGFSLAKHPNVLCMDADLQHEPEAVYPVAQPVLENSADFTVGSRYCGGDAGLGFDWAIHRKIISSVATLLASGVSRSTDPMSGFFCTKKTVVDTARKNGATAIGWKVGLEIMVRGQAQRVKDVGIVFRERVAGESKLTMKQNIEYLRQLGGLYWWRFKIVIMVLAVLLVIGLNGFRF